MGGITFYSIVVTMFTTRFSTQHSACGMHSNCRNEQWLFHGFIFLKEAQYVLCEVERDLNV